MRIRHSVAVICWFGLGLISCSRSPQPDAREAGREAYQASKDIKKDAKEAARNLREAGKQFEEGWKDAQREDQPRNAPVRPDPQRPARDNNRW